MLKSLFLFCFKVFHLQNPIIPIELLPNDENNFFPSHIGAHTMAIFGFLFMVFVLFWVCCGIGSQVVR